jgi:hypothetical protein
MCRRLGLGHWNQVSFLAIADFASGSAANDLSRLTHYETFLQCSNSEGGTGERCVRRVTALSLVVSSSVKYNCALIRPAIAYFLQNLFCGEPSEPAQIKHIAAFRRDRLEPQRGPHRLAL